MFNAELVGRQRVEKVDEHISNIRRGRTDYEIQQKAIEYFNGYFSSEEHSPDVGYELRARELEGEKDHHVVSVWISGGGSTGDFQIEHNKYTKPVIVVTDNKESNAKAIAEKHGAYCVEVDFNDWAFDEFGERDFKIQSGKRKNEFDAVATTRFFYPPGSKNIPPKDHLEYRYEIRKSFETVLWEKIEKVCRENGVEIDGIDLRGYRLPLISDGNNFYEGKDITDTHPGDMSWIGFNPFKYTGNRYVQLYGGWQSAVVRKMIRNRHDIICGSMLNVPPIENFKDSQSVDTGIILALGEGIGSRYYFGQPNFLKLNSKEGAEQVQGDMKYVEDMPLIALDPILRLIGGFSKKSTKVQFNLLYGPDATEDRDVVVLKQREVLYPGGACSGIYAIRPDSNQLDMIQDFVD